MNILDYIHSFIIPYHSNKELLYLIIQLLRDTLPQGLQYEIIVVANNKNKTELDLVLNEDVCKIIKINQDILYAKAVNIGVEQAKGDIITLFDQDIFCLPGWYEALFELYVSNSIIGAVGAKLLNPTDDRILDFGVAYTPYTSVHPTRGMASVYLASSFDRKVQAACSAVLMTDRDLFLSVGGMDHDMAYLCCDCDYCLKIAEKGYETWVAANAIVYHKGSSSGKNTKNSRYSYYAFDSSNMFYAKCYNKIRFDLEDWIMFICKDFASRNPICSRYLVVDLSTAFESEWYLSIIQKALDITIADIYKYNVGERKLSKLQLYDYVTLNLIDSVMPIIYFVDVIGSLESNRLWCRLRDIQKDIVIDINGNISMLTDVNAGTY